MERLSVDPGDPPDEVLFKDGTEVPADLVVMAVGIRPNIELAKRSGIVCDKGVLVNDTMMAHPMHLHGFDFRVLNQHGDHAPMKNIIDIMPMETDTIEFMANEEGDWFFHCHILYHMMAGMNRVLAVGHYDNPNLPDKEKAYKMLQRESDMPHLMAQNDFATNGIEVPYDRIMAGARAMSGSK